MGLKDGCQPQLPRNRNQHEPSYLLRMKGNKSHTIRLQEPAARAELPGSLFYSEESCLRERRRDIPQQNSLTQNGRQKKWTCRWLNWGRWEKTFGITETIKDTAARHREQSSATYSRVRSPRILCGKVWAGIHTGMGRRWYLELRCLHHWQGIEQRNLLFHTFFLKPFLSVQFSDIKYIHDVVQPPPLYPFPEIFHHPW